MLSDAPDSPVAFHHSRMPSIHCQSKIRAALDDRSLTLGVRHHLAAGEPSDSTHESDRIKFPQDVDVLLMSNLIITLSGVVDGAEVSNRDIHASGVAQHLLDYLQRNTAKLGLNTVSKLYGNGDGLCKLAVTPSRQFPLNSDTLPMHAFLIAIDLRYSWKIFGPSELKLGEPYHPFALKLTRPDRVLLDNVVGRFAKWQLVNRYPLIFGPWCQQLDKESFYFSTIASSILRVIKRSHSAAFRARCQRLIEILHRRRRIIFSDAATLFSTHLGIQQDEEGSSQSQMQEVADEGALKFALERVYRNGMPRIQFKGILNSFNDDKTASGEQNVPSPDEYDGHGLRCLGNASMDLPMLTDSSSPLNDSSFLDIQSDSDRGFFSDIDDSDKNELDGDDDELLLWKDHFDLRSDYLEPRHGIVDAPILMRGTYGTNDNSMSPVMSCGDDDEYLSIVSEDLNCKLGLSQSSLCDEQINCNGGPNARSSQDAIVELLETGRTSQAAKMPTSLPLPSPPISGRPLNRETLLMNVYPDSDGSKLRRSSAIDSRQDGNYPEHLQEATRQAPPSVLSDLFDSDDDLDINTGMDIDSSIHMEANLEGYRNLAGNGGVSVAMFTRPSLPETSYSHHSLTLGVTCPSQTNCDRQLSSFQEELEDNEELCRADIDGDSVPLDDFWEEDLCVLDF